MVRDDLALDGELHRLGVERRAVVELDALAELERVLQAIARDRPRLGEPGDDLRAALGERDERLHHATTDAVRVEIGDLRRIERHRLGHQADHQRASGLRDDDGGHQQDEQQRGDQPHPRSPRRAIEAPAYTRHRRAARSAAGPHRVPRSALSAARRDLTRRGTRHWRRAAPAWSLGRSAVGRCRTDRPG